MDAIERVPPVPVEPAQLLRRSNANIKMKLVLKGWTFEGSYSEKCSPELIEVLENLFPSTDSRSMPLMAALRRGDGALFGQIPDLLDKFKVPYEIS